MDPIDIKALLAKKKVTQILIAKHLNVSDAMVHLVIHGNATSRRIANYIAQTIDKPVTELWPDRYHQITVTKTDAPGFPADRPIITSALGQSQKFKRSLPMRVRHARTRWVQRRKHSANAHRLLSVNDCMEIAVSTTPPEKLTHEQAAQLQALATNRCWSLQQAQRYLRQGIVFWHSDHFEVDFDDIPVDAYARSNGKRLLSLMDEAVLRRFARQSSASPAAASSQSAQVGSSLETPRQAPSTTLSQAPQPPQAEATEQSPSSSR